MRLPPAILLASVMSWPASGQTYTISTFAGGALPAGIPGTSASLGSAPHTLRPITRQRVLRGSKQRPAIGRHIGILTLVAGNGTPGFSGDNGPATSAQLANPRPRRGLRRQPLHRRHQ